MGVNILNNRVQRKRERDRVSEREGEKYSEKELIISLSTSSV